MVLKLPDFNRTPEQLEFRDTLRRFFEESAPMATVRECMASSAGYSDKLWKEVCTGLALPGLALSESDGGQGFGLSELAIALEETGRSLAPVPLFSVSGLVAPMVSAVASGADRRRWLQPIADGSLATLAFLERAGTPSLETIESEVDTKLLLSGEKHFVLDAASARHFFVVARKRGTQGADGLGLYVVDADAKGVKIEGLESLDETRPVSRIAFDQVRAELVGEASVEMLRGALGVSTSLLVAEMVGGMQRILESAVDYASERFQFGRAIGSFQAIKHKAADMLIDFERARTASAAAVDAFDDADRLRSVESPSMSAIDGEEMVLTSVAKACAGPAFVRMATENIQIHGGVGYTWEYDAHLYFRRAHACAALLGDATWHHEVLAQRLARVAESSEGSPVIEGKSS